MEYDSRQKGRTVIDIHFFFDSITDILFLDSDYFDSILKNCTNKIISHVPHCFLWLGS